MTTFVAFTDIHADVDSAKRVAEKATRSKAEFLVCAGDVSLFGRGYRDCLSILRKLRLPVYFVPGNHDRSIAVDLGYGEFKGMMVDIAGKLVTHGDVDLVGIPEAGAGVYGIVADRETWETTEWMRWTARFRSPSPCSVVR